MNIKKSNGHSEHEWYDSNSYQETAYQEKRAAELRKDCKHKRSIASKPHDVRESCRKSLEIYKLIDSMNQNHHTKKQTKCENQQGSSFPPEMIGKQKFV